MPTQRPAPSRFGVGGPPGSPHSRGIVYVVGAGPGDPGLLTLKGWKCLARAHLVLHDALVNPSMMQYANPKSEWVCVDGLGVNDRLPKGMVQRMVEAAEQGRIVVRLKAGDARFVDRNAEEIAALAGAGVPFEVVPGIPAALSVGAYAGIELSGAGPSGGVAFIEGEDVAPGEWDLLDWGPWAALPGTLVFSGRSDASLGWAASLLRSGKPADAAVLIVSGCSRNDQRTFRCTLETLATTLAGETLGQPVVIVVGSVVEQAPATGWFLSRPLMGNRVVVTRPREQADGLIDRLEALGASVCVHSAIEIGPPEDWAPLDKALGRLDEFDWVVFSSSNGVDYLLGRVEELGGDLRRLGRVKLAAIGPGTAEQLARWHLRADLVPAEYRAEALAAALLPWAAGNRFLLARASRGREVLAEVLSHAGATVEQVVTYTSRDADHADPELVRMLSAGQIDWITVTSSAIARSLARLFGDGLRLARLASISPVTSQTLRELGHEPAAEASDYTMEGVAQAILRAT